MATTIRYETKTCGRCGGSGRYSFNAMHGDRCYGCGGTGIVLSAAGKKAKAAVEAWKTEHCSMRVDDICGGDRIFVGKYMTKTGYATITEGAHMSMNRAIGQTSNGVFKPTISVSFNIRKSNGTLERNGIGYTSGMTVVRAPQGAEWDALVAFARKFKGAIVTESAEAVTA